MHCYTLTLNENSPGPSEFDGERGCIFGFTLNLKVGIHFFIHFIYIQFQGERKYVAGKSSLCWDNQQGWGFILFPFIIFHSFVSISRRENMATHANQAFVGVKKTNKA